MYNLRLLIFVLLLTTFSVSAQEKKVRDSITIPSSIYVSTFEQEYNSFQFNPDNTLNKWDYRFILFDEARLESNLSNSLSFSSFGIKPSKFYLDTYKKLYDLKGQTQTFFKVEQLYEVPPQYSGYKRNK